MFVKARPSDVLGLFGCVFVGIFVTGLALFVLLSTRACGERKDVARELAETRKKVNSIRWQRPADLIPDKRIQAFFRVRKALYELCEALRLSHGGLDGDVNPMLKMKIELEKARCQVWQAMSNEEYQFIRDALFAEGPVFVTSLETTKSKDRKRAIEKYPNEMRLYEMPELQKLGL